MDKISGVNLDQFKGLIFMEAFDVVQDSPAKIDGLDPERLIEDLSAAVLGNRVVVLVVADILQVGLLGGSAQLRRFPQDGIPQCPGDEVRGFVRLGTADDKGK